MAPLAETGASLYHRAQNKEEESAEELFDFITVGTEDQDLFFILENNQ